MYRSEGDRPWANKGREVKIIPAPLFPSADGRLVCTTLSDPRKSGSSTQKVAPKPKS